MALPLTFADNKGKVTYEVPMGTLLVGRDEVQDTLGSFYYYDAYDYSQLTNSPSAPSNNRPVKASCLHPREVQNFVSVSDGDYGVTMSSCAAVCDYIFPPREQDAIVPDAEHNIANPMIQPLLLATRKSNQWSDYDPDNVPPGYPKNHGLYSQRGNHTFKFSVLSHAGNWSSNSLRGARFGIQANNPLRAVVLSGLPPNNSANTLDETKSFCSVSPYNIVVTAFKKKDGSSTDLIARMYDILGGTGTYECALSYFFDAESTRKTDIIEEDSNTGSLPVLSSDKRSVNITVGHHSIETFSLTPTLTTPAVPTGLTASYGAYTDKVRLTWAAAAGASGYEVFRSISSLTSEASLIASSTATNYNDSSASVGQQYYYWVKATNAYGASAFSASSSGWRASSVICADYDGDGKADPGIYGATAGQWYIFLSTANYIPPSEITGFGGTGWTAVAGDFDGDGKADPAVYQAATGNWQLQLSSMNYAIATLEDFGGSACVAAVADFDGDGYADPAIYNTTNGNWQVAMSSLGYGISTAEGFGGTGYTAVQENYDAVNRADAAIYNTANGNWTVLLSASSYISGTVWGFGGAGYTPVLGDFDGDGYADPAICEKVTGTWYAKLSSQQYAIATLEGFGEGNDTLMAADYDGDGKTDPAVMNTSGLLSVKLSSMGYATASLQLVQ